MWENDIRHGKGEMTFASGNKVTGTWENDRLNGDGIIDNMGKKPFNCVFKEDIAIGSDDQRSMGTVKYICISIFLLLGVVAGVLAILIL
jgi:hypothetical protein